jgi:hypothetical protein
MPMDRWLKWGAIGFALYAIAYRGSSSTSTDNASHTAISEKPSPVSSSIGWVQDMVTYIARKAAQTQDGKLLLHTWTSHTLAQQEKQQTLLAEIRDPFQSMRGISPQMTPYTAASPAILAYSNPKDAPPLVCGQTVQVSVVLTAEVPTQTPHEPLATYSIHYPPAPNHTTPLAPMLADALWQMHHEQEASGTGPAHHFITQDQLPKTLDPSASVRMTLTVRDAAPPMPSAKTLHTETLPAAPSAAPEKPAYAAVARCGDRVRVRWTMGNGPPVTQDAVRGDHQLPPIVEYMLQDMPIGSARRLVVPPAWGKRAWEGRPPLTAHHASVTLQLERLPLDSTPNATP